MWSCLSTLKLRLPKQIFMIKLWRNPSYKSFLCALTLCGYVSYMFGWHVHEKAILLVLVPLRYFPPPLAMHVTPFVTYAYSRATLLNSLLASENHAMFRTFMIASVAGIYSLFPLLFTPAGTFYTPTRLCGRMTLKLSHPF